MFGNPSRSLAHGEGDDRPDALAARFERIPERLLETAQLRGERELGEVALDQPTQLLRAAGHLLGPVPWRALPRLPSPGLRAPSAPRLPTPHPLPQRASPARHASPSGARAAPRLAPALRRPFRSCNLLAV